MLSASVILRIYLYHVKTDKNICLSLSSPLKLFIYDLSSSLKPEKDFAILSARNLGKSHRLLFNVGSW